MTVEAWSSLIEKQPVGTRRDRDDAHRAGEPESPVVVLPEALAGRGLDTHHLSQAGHKDLVASSDRAGHGCLEVHCVARRGPQPPSGGRVESGHGRIRPADLEDHDAVQQDRRGRETLSGPPRVMFCREIGRPQKVTARPVKTDKTSSTLEGDDRVAGDERCRQGAGKRPVDSTVGVADGVAPVLLARVGIERDDDDRVVGLIHRDRGSVDDADAGVSVADRTFPANLQGERSDVGEDTGLLRHSVDVRPPKLWPAATAVLRQRHTGECTDKREDYQSSWTGLVSVGPHRRPAVRIRVPRGQLWVDEHPRGLAGSRAVRPGEINVPRGQGRSSRPSRSRFRAPARMP